MRRPTRCLAPLLWLLLPGCSSPHLAQQEFNSAAEQRDRQAIGKVRESWREASTAKKGDAAQSLFAEGAVLLPADTPAIVSKEATSSYLRASFEESQVSNLKIEPQSTVIRGDTAIEWGRCSGTLSWGEQGIPAGSRNLENNYMLVLQKQADGQWRIVRSVSTNATLGSR